MGTDTQDFLGCALLLFVIKITLTSKKHLGQSEWGGRNKNSITRQYIPSRSSNSELDRPGAGPLCDEVGETRYQVEAKDRAQRNLSRGLAVLTHLLRLPNSTGTQVIRVKMVKREAGTNPWRGVPDPQLGRLIPQEGGPK